LLGYLLIVGSRFALPWAASAMPTTLLASLFLWHLLILPVVMLAMLLGAAVRSAAKFLKSKRFPSPIQPPAQAGEVTRRDLLKAAAVAAPRCSRRDSSGRRSFSSASFASIE
jgi:hypothetical protein